MLEDPRDWYRLQATISRAIRYAVYQILALVLAILAGVTILVLLYVRASGA